MDVEAVIGVWQSCELTRPWNDPADDFIRALNSPASTILIAEAENELIGTVMTGFDGHRGWIYYLGTLPDRQHKGIARTLIAAAERWLEGHGCPKVELMVRSGNPAADFYKRNGWEKQDVEVYARWLNQERD